MECKERIIYKLVLDFFNGLSFNDNEAIYLTWDDQKRFIDLTILSALVQKYPINRDYCKHFLKKIIKHVEQSSEDVHDELYICYCTLMQDSNESESEFCFKHYMIREDVDYFVTIKENPSLIVYGTTGLRTWEAAAVLADYALSNKIKFKGRNVLELGCGLGMTGIIVSKFCAPQSYCFSDCHPRVLQIAEENILINFPDAVKKVVNESIVQFDDVDRHCRISVLNLDWNSTDKELFPAVPDVVIGADIIYDNSTFEALTGTFEALIHLKENVEIYLVCTIRNEKTVQEFTNHLHQNNFKIDIINYENSKFIYWNSQQKYCIMKLHKC